MYYTSHLDTAKQLLSAYKPEVPLNLYLKTYFSRNKKHGSKDRKLISELCYNYFRLGLAAKDLSFEERILTGSFLCQHLPSDFLQFFKPEWNEMSDKTPEEKFALLNLNDKIFPFKDELSNEIDFEKFNISFLKQPKLFIRIRPGYENAVPAKLRAANITYEAISKNCIALPNASKTDAVIELDKEAVVQDYNSQKVGKFIKLAIGDQASEISRQQSAINVWDLG